MCASDEGVEGWLIVETGEAPRTHDNASILLGLGGDVVALGIMSPVGNGGERDTVVKRLKGAEEDIGAVASAGAILYAIDQAAGAEKHNALVACNARLDEIPEAEDIVIRIPDVG